MAMHVMMKYLDPLSLKSKFPDSSRYMYSVSGRSVVAVDELFVRGETMPLLLTHFIVGVGN